MNFFLHKVPILYAVFFILAMNSCSKDTTNVDQHLIQTEVYNGYYFVQELNAYNTSQYGAISTAEEAREIAVVLKSHSVSALEYQILAYSSEDVKAGRAVAAVFKEYGIDLWLASINFIRNINQLNQGIFPEQYRGYSMTNDGSIVPGVTNSVSMEETPAFDVLDPQAVGWLIDAYIQNYILPLGNYASGFIFDEDCIHRWPGDQNNKRVGYWELPVYSDVSLGLWQQYCIDHAIKDSGIIVDKFPVHLESMVANGAGKTAYYPGYNVPEVVEAGTAITSMPRNSGVWAAWDDFVTSQYVNNWIGRISDAVSDANANNSNFKGVIYFGHHSWSLGYEEVADQGFMVDSYMGWVPWGTQFGVQLSKICALPNVDYIICETYPPIKANLGKFAGEFKRITEAHGKKFGLMLHRDDNWGLGDKDTEEDRWQLIRQLKPVIIARYPRVRLFPENEFYKAEREQYFDEQLKLYRE